MAADAFAGTLIIEGERTKERQQYAFTVSDVANSYFVFQDGQNFVQVPADQNYRLVDIICTEDGSDTTNGILYANGRATGIIVYYGANLTTSYSRQFQMAPQLIKGGTLLAFKQTA